MIENGEVKDKRYRVFVQLEQWFSDERGRCVVSVSGTQRTEWLAQRLRRLLRLEGRFCLLTDGHLMPPDELLAHVLQPDECVQVVPTKHDWFDEFPEEEGEKQCLYHNDEQTDMNNIILMETMTSNVDERDGETMTSNVDERDGETRTSNVDECDGENKCPDNNTLKRKSDDESLLDIKRKALEELEKLYSNQGNANIENKYQLNDILVDFQEDHSKRSHNEANANINIIKQNDISGDLELVCNKRPRRRRVRRRRTPRLVSDTDPTPAPSTTDTTPTQCSPPHTPSSPAIATNDTSNDNDCSSIVAPLNELTEKSIEISQVPCGSKVLNGKSLMLSNPSVQIPVVRNMNERRAPRVVHSINISPKPSEVTCNESQ